MGAESPNVVSSKKEMKLTKRQKRRQPVEKNKWPQHPKIQNMDQRQKAYIRVAGLGTSSKGKETIDPKLDLMSPEVKFGRLLGGTDQRKRHAAVQKLKQYLKARCDINNENGGISELDLLKLWKGLWFTLYMADKVAVQDELAKKLAELLWCVAGTEEEDEYAGQAYMAMCAEEDASDESEDSSDDDVTMEEIVKRLDQVEDQEVENDSSDERSGEDSDEVHDQDERCDHDDVDNETEEYAEELDDSEIPHCRGAHLASLFIRTFFRTIRREWGNMDKYRVDKFYSLIRMYLHEIFKYMSARHWNIGIIRLFNDALFEEVLKQTPNGMRYHLIDITLEELAKVNSRAPMPLTEATFLDTLEPYFAMCQTGSGNDTVQARVMEKVLDNFLDNYSVVCEKADVGEKADDSGESVIFDQVHVGSVADFIFELASDPETKDQYRKSLYDMHKKYARRIKQSGKDVVLDEGSPEPIEDIDEGMDASLEIPQEVDEPAVEHHSDAPSSRAKKPKKRKRKHSTNDKDAPMGEPFMGQEDYVDIVVKQKETKSEMATKEKKKQSKKAKEDDEVLISVSEQKVAKSEARKRKKQKKQKVKADHPESKSAKADSLDEDRRVKFNKVNRSKSYKASMKALVTRDVPSTSELTPEKGILRTKRRAKKAGVATKAGRKRAVNYF